MSRARARGAAAALVAALTISGCAAQDAPPPYATATAADLQQTVLHVTEAAGAGELASALKRLEELEVSTKVAHARGELTLARQDSILSAIALVKADLEAMMAEAERKAEEARQKAEAEAKQKAEEEARRKADARKQAEAEAQRQAEAQRVAQERVQRETVEGSNGGGDDESDGAGDNRGKDKGKEKKDEGEEDEDD